jgi:hypothetical protein
MVPHNRVPDQRILSSILLEKLEFPTQTLRIARDEGCEDSSHSTEQKLLTGETDFRQTRRTLEVDASKTIHLKIKIPAAVSGKCCIQLSHGGLPL